MIRELEKREKRNIKLLAAGALNMPTHDSLIHYQGSSVEKSAFHA